MKKILFVSHTANFSKFNYAYMKQLRENGVRVDYASDGEEEILECDRSYKVCFDRSPFKKSNVKAYHQLKQIIDTEKYDIIHCHTPVGGAVARLASVKRRKEGGKLLYTAHGFHFFKGAPLINWILYYPVEKILARYTDCLITINNEDYTNAVRRKFKAGSIEQINGVGIELKRFLQSNPELKLDLREQYGISKKRYILVCVAEINKNKNQKFLIQQLAELKKKIPEVMLFLVGVGPKEEECRELVDQYKLRDDVIFWGYRKDVPKLLAMSDVLVSASQREGLAVNIIEGLATGLPIVCPNTRGQRDLVVNEENGILYEVNDSKAFCEGVLRIYNDRKFSERVSKNNLECAKQYSVEHSIQKMNEIYRRYF